MSKLFRRQGRSLAEIYGDAIKQDLAVKEDRLNDLRRQLDDAVRGLTTPPPPGVQAGEREARIKALQSEVSGLLAEIARERLAAEKFLYTHKFEAH
jgi:hypothetical protein